LRENVRFGTCVCVDWTGMGMGMEAPEILGWLGWGNDIRSKNQRLNPFRPPTFVTCSPVGLLVSWFSSTSRAMAPCTDGGFKQRKINTMSKMDQSAAGRIDARAVKICSLVNSLDDFYTTSSCAGRCHIWRGSGYKATTVQSNRFGNRGHPFPCLILGFPFTPPPLFRTRRCRPTHVFSVRGGGGGGGVGGAFMGGGGGGGGVNK
jgi:hypothetical protein